MGIPSARGNKSACGRDSYRFVQDSSRGDDGLEGENPERARECIFARKRFPSTPSTKNPPDNVGGIVRGDDGNRTRVISLED